MAPPPLDVAGWVDSEPLTLAALKGKVVVVDFWGIFCAPCKKLMPHLDQLYDKHRGAGLVVLGVSEDEKPDIEKFAKEIEVTYPLAADRLVEGNGVTLGAYKIVAIPTVYLIGRSGKIVWVGDGPKLTDKMVLDELARK
jgi:thiol-disulfide isomerase/thioredoxin